MVNNHQKMLHQLFEKTVLEEIFKRIKEPTFFEIDTILYFGDKETREYANQIIIPEKIRGLNYIDLIRFEENFKSFITDFEYSLNLIQEEIKIRKRRVGD